MAKDDIEVEIKLKVGKAPFLKVKRILAKEGKFQKKSIQIDQYFTPSHRNFLKPKYPFEWVSIRKRGGKGVLNYKHFYPEGAEVKTHSDEYEIETKNLPQLEKLFKALDFKSLVTVKKEREVYIYKKLYEIAFDKVAGLGCFIEIESLNNSGGVAKTREKLFEFAKFLGLGSVKADERGYPYLLMDKKGLLK